MSGRRRIYVVETCHRAFVLATGAEEAHRFAVAHEPEDYTVVRILAPGHESLPETDATAGIDAPPWCACWLHDGEESRTTREWIERTATR